jgi:hypothetical protein
MKVDPELQAKTVADLSRRCDGPDQFEKLDRAFRATLTVSKIAVEKEESRLKRARARARKK